MAVSKNIYHQLFLTPFPRGNSGTCSPSLVAHTTKSLIPERPRFFRCLLLSFLFFEIGSHLANFFVFFSLIATAETNSWTVPSLDAHINSFIHPMFSDISSLDSILVSIFSSAASHNKVERNDYRSIYKSPTTDSVSGVPLCLDTFSPSLPFLRLLFPDSSPPFFFPSYPACSLSVSSASRAFLLFFSPARELFRATKTLMSDKRSFESSSSVDDVSDSSSRLWTIVWNFAQDLFE